MLAQFQTKVVYLSDNATQTQTKMTENRKSYKLGNTCINFYLWAVTYMTVIYLLPQRQVLMHNHYLTLIDKHSPDFQNFVLFFKWKWIF